MVYKWFDSMAHNSWSRGGVKDRGVMHNCWCMNRGRMGQGMRRGRVGHWWCMGQGNRVGDGMGNRSWVGYNMGNWRWVG